jgi:hypothetical protein
MGYSSVWMDQEPMPTPSPSNPAAAVTGRYTRQALVVAAESAQAHVKSILAKLEFECEVFEDPYAAMLELLRRPMVFRAVVLSLQGLYREELAMIRTLRTRMPRLDVFVTHIEGREASLADAMKLGATGIVADDGLHRLHEIEATPVAQLPVVQSPVAAQPSDRPQPEKSLPRKPEGSVVARPVQTATISKSGMNDDYDLPGESIESKPADAAFPASPVVETPMGMQHTPEPVLSAEEIRALLSDQE